MIGRVITAAAIALTASSAFADECGYVSEHRYLYFVHSGSVAVVVDRDYRELPYACTTSTLGTGISGRALSCSDGYDGALRPTDTGITFRDAEWESTCDDNRPMDIGYGN